MGYEPHDTNRVRPGARGWEMLVFRDGRYERSGPELLRELAAVLRCSGSDNERVEALLRAGELECALADAGHPSAATLATITDLAAEALLNPALPLNRALPSLPEEVPDLLEVSAPEGFAYYALHPRDFAAMADRLDLRSNHALVAGIRSIGTTLSAVVGAALRRRGIAADRFTVRPEAHPYDRRCNFAEEQVAAICVAQQQDAEFLIVDEGPGISGSSFLSVADALVARGAERSRITLVCSREPDVDQLRAPDGPRRWREYRAVHPGESAHRPAEAHIYAGGGEWRRHLLGDGAEWPESWLHMERLKYLSADKRTLFKFEGHGQFGRAVHERAKRAFEAGFAPAVHEPQCGYGVYPIVAGTPLRPMDGTEAVLLHIAQYCAWRAREMRAAMAARPERLAEMTRHNARQEFGVELDLGAEAFAAANTVVCDGRMQSHEWLRTPEGKLLKLDGSIHGDDHFFPGPCDIAWDLAGTIVEWELDGSRSAVFLKQYRALSGDDASPRLPAYLAAYSLFRMAFCKMGAEAVEGSGEESRLWRAYERYRGMAEARIPELSAAAVVL